MSLGLGIWVHGFRFVHGFSLDLYVDSKPSPESLP